MAFLQMQRFFFGGGGGLDFLFQVKLNKKFYGIFLRLHYRLLKRESEVAQSYLTLCDPVDCSLPGSSNHGILQARILEWVAVSFSRGTPSPGIKPRSPTLEADALTSEPPGKPG